ncbi:MAG: hypothetical protein IBX67_07345 [Dehalococcoidia bacterium]|nr:hypothetical protein [Dehalococcoidia bacterium]
MKEEELVKKLEGVELPGTQLESHRRRLRMAVLNAGHLLNEQPKVTSVARARSRVSRGMDTLRRGLVARQPVWKTAAVGISTVALIAGLATALPLLTGQSPEELAASIVRTSPEVRAALVGTSVVGADPVTQDSVVVLAAGVVEMEFMKEDGDDVRVLVKGEWGRYAVADVNLEVKEVTRVYTFPEFSDDEKARAREIARAAPGVQELLAQGGRVAGVIAIAMGDTDGDISFKLHDEEGEIAVEGGRILPAAVIVLDNQTWLVLVDIDEGEVVRILDPKLAAEVAASIETGLRVAKLVDPPVPSITEAEKEKAINIAKADSRVQEILEKGTEIVVVQKRHTPTTVQSDVFMVLELPGEELLTIVEVDLTAGKVVRIIPEP